MKSQSPVSIVADEPARYLRENARFAVRRGARMRSPNENATTVARINAAADRMSAAQTWEEFEAARLEAVESGVFPTNGQVSRVALAATMAD